MENAPVHEIKLYPFEAFKTLLNHEINKSRRYGGSLTLVDILIETDPATPEAMHKAKVLTINVLNLHLRDVDIPCRRNNEFIILMPSTSAPGARTACERIRNLMNTEHKTISGLTFKLSTFIGMATLPHDYSIPLDEFSQNASQALQYARTNHITDVVSFSEIPK